MPALKKRLGASICLTAFSLITIILLLPSSRVSTQLQKIGLPSSIDQYWNWGEEEEEEDVGGIRLVVFGDSWVDHTVEDGQTGKGKSYAEVLCDEINCTSCLNYAASQPSTEYPERPPRGAMTSNLNHDAAMNISSRPSIATQVVPEVLLPDLVAQVDSFINLPAPKTMPPATIFLLSFGFWDIYDFADVDFQTAKSIIDSSVTLLFSELNILYDHFVDMYNTIVDEEALLGGSNSTVIQKQPSFKVIIPKLFDPTLLPGWSSERPLPVLPDTVAEQQKNAVYLTTRWNTQMEFQMTSWINNDLPKEDTENQSAANKSISRDVIYYDLPSLLLDLLVEHQLEDEGLHDASGLGKGESPFQSVYLPCMQEGGSDDTKGFVEVNGLLVCQQPEEYLWWDGWNLGKLAKEMIGKEIAIMVKEGKTLKAAWEQAKHVHGH